jgi:pimeloyl-ACP methyl ester carboxylesterase
MCTVVKAISMEGTARFVANQIPNAVLHIPEGTDHSPHQWQQERFARDLMAFIDQTR